VISKGRISDEVYAKTEPERHMAEVNFVSKQSGEWIKEFLEKVKEKRGFESYKNLRNDVLKVWKDR
jgi:hypothetical protein